MMDQPYTLPYLRQQLDFICGEGKYTLTQNYDKYSLFIDTVLNSHQFKELRILFYRIMPANIHWILGRTVETAIEEYKKRFTFHSPAKKAFIGDIEMYRNNKVPAWIGAFFNATKTTVIGDE